MEGAAPRPPPRLRPHGPEGRIRWDSIGIRERVHQAGKAPAPAFLLDGRPVTPSGGAAPCRRPPSMTFMKRAARASGEKRSKGATGEASRQRETFAAVSAHGRKAAREARKRAGGCAEPASARNGRLAGRRRFSAGHGKARSGGFPEWGRFRGSRLYGSTDARRGPALTGRRIPL